MGLRKQLDPIHPWTQSVSQVKRQTWLILGPGYIHRLGLQNNPPKNHEHNPHTIGPGLNAPELVEELCLSGTLQFLDKTSAIRRDLKFVLVRFLWKGMIKTTQESHLLIESMYPPHWRTFSVSPDLSSCLLLLPLCWLNVFPPLLTRN